MTRSSTLRLFWWYAAGIVAAAMLLRCALVVLIPAARTADIVEYFYDDGYYYLSVAANLADLGRSTFDGLTLTNGYQPLWLLLLTGLAKLVGTAPHTLFAAAVILVSVIILAALAMGAPWRRNEDGYLPVCLSVAIAVMVLRWPQPFIGGLETTLLLPLLVLLVLRLARLTDPRQLYYLSALLAVAFLIRLDNLALYAGTVLALTLPLSQSRPAWCQGGWQKRLELVLKLAAFVLPTVLVYALINWWLFDSPVPVSGLAKTIGGAKFSNWGVAHVFYGPAKDAAFFLLLLLPLEWLARRWSRPEPVFYRSLLVFGLASVFQCLYFCTSYSWDVMQWYETLVMAVMALVVARILYLAWLLADVPKLRVLGYVSMAIVALWMLRWAASLVDKIMPADLRVAVRQTVHMGDPRVAEVTSFNQVTLSMLHDFFDPNRHTLVAMGDRAGGLGFWGRRSVAVLQLEGLMLDIGYVRARRQQQGNAYIESKFPIEYLLTDREVMPTVNGPGGEVEYVVADPVRGRISRTPVPTFCFPSSAVRYVRKYSTFTGDNVRMAFAFGERVPCSTAAVAMIESIETGIGLQKYSLPGEYDTSGGFASAALEARDRSHTN